MPPLHTACSDSDRHEQDADSSADSGPLQLQLALAATAPQFVPASVTGSAVVPLGPFDGRRGEFAGQVPDPERLGVPANTDLGGYAAAVLDRQRPARDRYELQRCALLSAAADYNDRELLAAGALWLQAITRAAANTFGDRAQWPGWVSDQVEWATHGVFELGAAKLAIRVAARYTHPGALSEGEELRQIAQDAMLEALFDFDADKGIVSAFAYPKVNCRVADHVWKTEHPGVPRTAFKRRGAIREAYRIYLAEVEAGHRDPLGPDSIVELIASQVPHVTENGVRQVLFGMRTVSLDAELSSQQDGFNAHDIVADSSQTSRPAELSENRETIALIVAAADSLLDDEERILLDAYYGLSTGQPQSYRMLERSWNGSRAWIQTRVQRAISKLQHPMVVGDLLALDTTSREGERVVALPAPSWTNALDVRQRKVACLFFGYGGTPLPGTPQQRRDRLVHILDAAPWVVDRLIKQVHLAKNGEPVPPLYDRWYEEMSARQQDAARIVLGYTKPSVDGTYQERVARLAVHLDVSETTASALADQARHAWERARADGVTAAA